MDNSTEKSIEKRLPLSLFRWAFETVNRYILQNNIVNSSTFFFLSIIAADTIKSLSGR